MRQSRVIAVFTALACVIGAGPALAHPHVWVTTKAEVIYAPDGKVTGVRHIWTFDPAYSVYVTQGLDANKDGTLTPDELQDLAKVNTDSLADFEYFTVVKANGAKQAFDAPRDPGMTFAEGKATLSFNLPLKTPAAANKALALEVYDPTYFVSFSAADGADAVTLTNAPKGCVANVTRPKPIEAAQQQKLSEAFFEAMTAASNFGSQQANRTLVACP